MDFTASSFRHLLDVAVGVGRDVVSASTVEADARFGRTEDDVTKYACLSRFLFNHFLHVSPHEERAEEHPRPKDEQERKNYPPVDTLHGISLNISFYIILRNNTKSPLLTRGLSAGCV